MFLGDVTQIIIIPIVITIPVNTAKAHTPAQDSCFDSKEDFLTKII